MIKSDIAVRPNIQTARTCPKKAPEKELAFAGKAETDAFTSTEKRVNVETHNAKVRAAGYTMFFGPFASVYYALKNPEKMANESRKDQVKEDSPEAELAKQKDIKRAQVKASIVTAFCELGFGVGGLLPFLAYKFAEDPENPSKTL